MTNDQPLDLYYKQLLVYIFQLYNNDYAKYFILSIEITNVYLYKNIFCLFLIL